MKLELPQLDLSPENVTKNHETLLALRAKVKAFTKALDGLIAANRGMCNHPKGEIQKHYDPGYAGGGFSHDECLVCGQTTTVPGYWA